jgi:predicted metal-dependent phosphotriesterase family hydrolase
MLSSLLEVSQNVLRSLDRCGNAYPIKFLDLMDKRTGSVQGQEIVTATTAGIGRQILQLRPVGR